MVIDRIAGYIATHGIKGRIKLWMSGYSRAAAVVNLTAGRLTQAGPVRSDTAAASRPALGRRGKGRKP